MKKKQRSGSRRVVVSMEAKLHGKIPVTLAVFRKGPGKQLVLLVTNKKDDENWSMELEIGQGEALHTALHAIGVWAWGGVENR